MAVDVEHAIQKQMLERLGIEWTPGEPFYSLVENEILRLRWLIEWVDYNASFQEKEWQTWEELKASREPWLVDEGV
jgi:hypothetical protein